MSADACNTLRDDHLRKIIVAENPFVDDLQLRGNGEFCHAASIKSARSNFRNSVRDNHRGKICTLAECVIANLCN